ncbi:MAG: iron-containing alcohol dehydrogenase [Oscillibacter sp.]|nr:iron-containing alcohol dehydrogenase [Oscillibacter sp.]
MLNFSFHCPTLFAFGDGEEQRTGELVRRFGGTKVLLVYGGGSIFKNGAYDDAAASLNRAGIPFVELGGVQPNPRSGKVYEGIGLCRAEGVDFVLAVGGGSAIDTAKAIAVGTLYEGDFWDFYTHKAADKSLPVGVVLTLSATGSEASPSTVITHENGDLKWGNVKTDVYRPVFAVMNPRYTCSLPPYQTACGAMDMLSHVMERYFTTTDHVDVTDRICEGLMQTILSNALKAMENPDDYNARAELMWCGTLAHNNLCGVGRAQDWASHQMSHELSALYDSAHGATLSVITPAWMQYVLHRDPQRFAQFAVRVFGCQMDFHHPELTAQEGIERLKHWIRAMGLPLTLKEIGALQDDIPAMVAHRMKKPGGFPFGGFAPIHETDMALILELAAR